MKKKQVSKYISTETIAAYLDGNATAAECKEILDALAYDEDLRELMRISHEVDCELGVEEQNVEILPMTALAASCNESNFCCIECEKYILDKHGVEYDEQQMFLQAAQNNWQKKDGTALYNVGRHLENFNFTVSRQYKCSMSDIANALDRGCDVIVAVDGGELLGNPIKEYAEDILVGDKPDHTVVVLAYDINNDVITIYDPNSAQSTDTYPIAGFANAWHDSKNYMVTISSTDKPNTYKPQPIDLSDVVLPEEFNELREAIAENAHEVWAAARQAEGWTYGPRRDDKLKQHPDMLPYAQLPDSEKEYDRLMAMDTLRLMYKLGYDLVQRSDTDAYKALLRQIKQSKDVSVALCPHCGNIYISTHCYCSHCGKKLK